MIYNIEFTKDPAWAIINPVEADNCEVRWSLGPDVLYDLAANAAAIVGGFETAAQCMMKEIPGED